MAALAGSLMGHTHWPGTLHTYVHTYMHFLAHNTVQPETFAGGNFHELDEVEQFVNKTFADCRSYPTHAHVWIKLSWKEAMQ